MNNIDKMLAPYGTTKEYECAKEISRRLKELGETEISFTKVSILLYLLYQEDTLNKDCFHFDTTFYKNIYGIPCNQNVTQNFETEKLYKEQRNVFMSWLDTQEKMFDDLIFNYGTLSPAELYHMLQYDPFISNTEINQEIVISREAAIANHFEISPLDKLLQKILRKPSDFYTKVCEELTPKERIFILQNLINKSCLSCSNGSCRVPYAEKLGVDESGKPQGSQCIGWWNEELIGKSKVLRRMDINKLK